MADTKERLESLALDSNNAEVPPTTTELTRGNRKSQLHEFTGELTSKVNSHYLSRSQWLQLPNSTARQRIQVVPLAFVETRRK